MTARQKRYAGFFTLAIMATAFVNLDHRRTSINIIYMIVIAAVYLSLWRNLTKKEQHDNIRNRGDRDQTSGVQVKSSTTTESRSRESVNNDSGVVTRRPGFRER